MWCEATNLFVVSGKADSGSQHGTKTRKNEGNRSLGTTSFISAIAISLCHPLHRVARRMYWRAIPEILEYWKKRSGANKWDKREEIPGEDRQYMYIEWWWESMTDLAQELLSCRAEWTLHTPETDSGILLAKKESEFFIEGLLLKFVLFLKYIRGMKSLLILLDFSA